MISSSLRPEDKKEFVSGGTCEVMKSRRELRQRQTVHLGQRSLSVVLAALGIWVPKRRKWVIRTEREGTRGKKLSHEDLRLCNR